MSKLSTYLSSSGIGLPGREAVAELLGPRLGYLSIAGAAQYASVSTRTIKRWINAGLPVYQGTTRGKVLIRPNDIDLYLQRKAAQKPTIDLDGMVNQVLSDLSAKSIAA